MQLRIMAAGVLALSRAWHEPRSRVGVNIRACVTTITIDSHKGVQYPNVLHPEEAVTHTLNCFWEEYPHRILF